MRKFIAFFKKNYNSRVFIILYSFLFVIILYFLSHSLILTNYKCPFKSLFNIYCAGCGATRMFVSIYKLEFYQAFRYNPLIFIYLILMIIYVIYCFIKYKRIKIPNYKVIILLIVLMIVFMILRNIETFSYLKPTKI